MTTNYTNGHEYIHTKTIKTPLMMSAAYGLTCCPCSLVPESELSYRYQAHHRLVSKLSHHGGKNPVPLCFTKKTFTFFLLPSYIFPHPSYLIHPTSSILHHSSSIIHHPSALIHPTSSIPRPQGRFSLFLPMPVCRTL